MSDEKEKRIDGILKDNNGQRFRISNIHTISELTVDSHEVDIIKRRFWFNKKIQGKIAGYVFNGTLDNGYKFIVYTTVNGKNKIYDGCVSAMNHKMEKYVEENS